MDKLPVLQIALRKRIFSQRVSLYIALPQLVRGIVYYLRSRRERSFYFSATAAATAQHPGDSYLAISLQSHIALHPFPSLASWEMSIRRNREWRRKNMEAVYFSSLVFWFKAWRISYDTLKSSWFRNCLM